jgi:hypothetical protein
MFARNVSLHLKPNTLPKEMACVCLLFDLMEGELLWQTKYNLAR